MPEEDPYCIEYGNNDEELLSVKYPKHNESNVFFISMWILSIGFAFFYAIKKSMSKDFNIVYYGFNIALISIFMILSGIAYTNSLRTNVIFTQILFCIVTLIYHSFCVVGLILFYVLVRLGGFNKPEWKSVEGVLFLVYVGFSICVYYLVGTTVSNNNYGDEKNISNILAVSFLLIILYHLFMHIYFAKGNNFNSANPLHIGWYSFIIIFSAIYTGFVVKFI